jgi:hypothetical protein
LDKSIKKGLVIAVIFLFIAVSFQPIIAEKTVFIEEESDYKNWSFDEAKDYLFQTIIGIANNPDVKNFFEQLKCNQKIFTSNYDYKSVFSQLFLKKPTLLLSILFTKPSITYEYLDKTYNRGIKSVNILGEKQVLEMTGSIKISNPDLMDELNKIIKNDKELSNRISTLGIINNNLKSNLDFWDNPIICSILIICYLPTVIAYIFFETASDWVYEHINNYLLLKIYDFFYSIDTILFIILLILILLYGCSY